MKITTELIKQIASKSKLKLTDAEVEQFKSDFESILTYISQMQSLDLTDVPDTHNLKARDIDYLHQDEVEPSKIKKEDLMQIAGKNRIENAYIRVRNSNRIEE